MQIQERMIVRRSVPPTDLEKIERKLNIRCPLEAVSSFGCGDY